jgi:hypothetical protein
MEWWVGPRVRCDLVGYSGINLNGIRRVVQVFPSGSRKGGLRTGELKSIVVLAPIGVRVILCASADRHKWQEAAWRCVRQLPGYRFTNAEGNTGVRIPDFDWMDPPDQKKRNEDTQVSYPFAARLEDGVGWTFGRGGGLGDRVNAILIEREDEPWTP